MAHRALIADDSPRPTRTAVHKNRPPPIANPGFQRARLQRLSSGPTLARKLPVSVASRTSSARPRMTKATPTTARSTPAARQSVRRDPAASHHDQRNPDEKEGTDTEQPEHHETRRASLCQLTGRRGKTGCPAYRPEQVYGCEDGAPCRRAHGRDAQHLPMRLGHPQIKNGVPSRSAIRSRSTSKACAGAGVYSSLAGLSCMPLP